MQPRRETSGTQDLSGPPETPGHHAAQSGLVHDINHIPMRRAFGMTSNRVGGPPDRQPNEPKAVKKLQEQIFALCKMARRRLNQPRLDQPLRAARVSRCIIRVIAVWRDGPG